MNYSIVMPVCLVREEHRSVVEETIKSIRETTNGDELIIIDDGSRLDTSFLKDAADIYYRQSNLGISKAWNVGKNKATHNYVAIVNDDIRLPIGWLSKLAQCFSFKGCGVAAPLRGGPNISPTIIGNSVTSGRKFYPGYCFMLKRDRFFEDFDEEFRSNCGDTDYWYRVESEGLTLMRAGFSVYHKEGGVLGNMGYKELSQESLQLFKNKWGFDPIPEYYG